MNWSSLPANPQPDACPGCGEVYPRGLWDHIENCPEAKEKINK